MPAPARLPVLLLALLLAACASQGDVAGRGTTTGTPIIAGFVPSSPGVVQVIVEDRQAARTVELVGPGGTIYPAQSIERGRIEYEQDRYGYTRGYRPGYYNPPYDVAVGTFGSSTGHLGADIGTGVPFYGANETVPRPIAVKSVARIQVEDMAGYKATWQQWRTRIRFDGGRVIELPAPQPPIPLPPKS